MPQRKKPITQRPKAEDESTGNPPERHGKHRAADEALPGKGGTKAGLNKQSGGGSLGTGQKGGSTPRRDRERSLIDPAHERNERLKARIYGRAEDETEEAE